MDSLSSSSSEVSHDGIECTHADLMKDESGMTICLQCGLQFELLDFEPEWNAYSDEGSNARCHHYKTFTKGALEKLFASEDKLACFSQSYKRQCIHRYSKVVGTDTIRGSQRKAIAAACMLFVCRDNGDMKTTEDIRLLFSVPKMKMSEGLTKYLSVFPEDRVRHISASDMVERIAKKIDPRLTPHLMKISEFTTTMRKKSKMMVRSSPQLLAVSCVYYYIQNDEELRELISMDKASFVEKSSVSDVTPAKVTKLMKEIQRVKGVVMVK